MEFTAFILDRPFRLIMLATALGFMALEYWLGRLTDRHTHDWRESAASFGVALGQRLVRAAEAGIVAIPFAFAYRHRLFEFSATSARALLGLFFGSEFLYYCQHPASHRIRLMWATHRVHHSPVRLNLTAAIRLGWTGNISGNFLFFLPLAWIGFHPFAIVAMLGINLFYQLLIHTELAPRLGPLELFMNTPTHHRVHHASNEACLDRNFDGMLIVFDRLAVRHLCSRTRAGATPLPPGRRHAVVQSGTHRLRRVDQHAARCLERARHGCKAPRSVRTARRLSRGGFKTRRRKARSPSPGR